MSVLEFFSMGGYGLYVWGSYGVTALLMVMEVIYLRRHKQSLLGRIRRKRKMQSRLLNETQT